MTNQIQKLSTCCKADIEVVGGDEGTNHYECLVCKKPCDTITFDTTTATAAPTGTPQTDHIIPDTIITTQAKPEEAPKKCGRCTKEKKENVFDVTKEYCNCGRPTKYTDELLEKAWKYVDLKMPCKETDEVIHSIEGLTDFIDINRETAYEWVKDPEKDEFSNIVKAVLKKQGKKLINNGLSGVFEQGTTKLLLSKHGYRDAVDNFNREVPVDPAAKAAADGAIDAFLEAKK